MNRPLPRLSLSIVVAVAAFCAVPASAGGLAVNTLRCEYLPNPLGIDQTAPRLSWQVASAGRGQKQTAYRILVAASRVRLDAGEGDLWDTGKVPGDRTSGVVYRGERLTSRRRCFWKVMVWDTEGRASDWSAPASWSMGLLQPGDWQAEWISYRDESPLEAGRDALFLPPPRYYRKPFAVAKPVRRATVYATALGIYELHVNGSRVGDARFTPGWSDYRQRVYYNTYDVTGLVRRGENAVGAIVADGWYSGYVGFGLLLGYGPNHSGRFLYGKTPAVRVQLEIEYADGSRDVVATDPTWQVTGAGPIREADILMGETCDARLDLGDWTLPGYDAAGWQTAVPAAANGSTKAPFFDSRGRREVELGFCAPKKLQAYPSVPVRAVQEIAPIGITEPEPGVFIFDMGQNFSGVVRLAVRGPEGTRLRLRYGEMLYPDGRLMTENLRRARATDFYVLRGDPEGEHWMPRFTYHGFRYVELTGLAEKPGLDTLTGVVIHSDTPLTSSLECSDSMVNRLFENIVWTQQSNFFELPTDCPQRDERLGWTGDAQIYIGAAAYNADVAAFFTKWLDDLEESQLPNGAYPAYAPLPMQHGVDGKAYGSAWMDAGIICPWTIWQMYGDTRVIERHYDSMTRFMDFRRSQSPDFRGKQLGNAWGDWLSVGEKTPIELIDAAYFAYTAKRMAEMAAAVGKADDAAAYRALSAKVKAAFEDDYVKGDGTLSVETQTAYALALSVGLVPQALRGKTAGHLAGMIRQNGGRMRTGFLGTQPLLPVLSATGHHDLAVALLQSRAYPSWGYEVVNGATTVWERWNSFTTEHGFMDAGMNSFSHYAFGAVCRWMFESLSGIAAGEPGFEKIVIRPGPPTPGSRPAAPPLDWVHARYDSIRGRIVCHWKQQHGRFQLDVTIPANTTATVYLPAGDPASILESGAPPDRASGVTFLRTEGGRAVLAIGSGSYRFASRYSERAD